MEDLDDLSVTGHGALRREGDGEARRDKDKDRQDKSHESIVLAMARGVTARPHDRRDWRWETGPRAGG